MDSDTKQRWLKVKVALEAAGKTDCHYYQRALAVLNSGFDPGPIFTTQPHGK